MNEPTDPLEDPTFAALLEEFLARTRRGEGPSPEAYAARHPELAGPIREIFPTLLVLQGHRAAPAQLEQSLPAVLGDYQVVREVGRGGMGVVYEAVQRPLGRRVALKVLPARLAEKPAYRERFLREAQAAARLHHGNIVPVFASGECAGTLYYAMQFIDGRSLAQVLDRLCGRGVEQAGVAAGTDTPSAVVTPDTAENPRSGLAAGNGARPPLPADHARAMARLGLAAAEALAHAHGQGVLHRDVKPANLMVDVAGVLWIADFGLAKAEGAADLTGTGEVVGTLRYLAPERFAGRCDGRSDVYALGVTLYEMLALRPAFAQPDRLQLVSEIGRGAAPPLRRVAPWVPADLETVVHKAMAAEPERRYANAQELADDLRLFLADLPVRARRSSAWEQLRRWAGRNPALASLSAAVALLVLALLIGSLVAAWRLNRVADRAVQAEHQAVQAEHQATDRLFDALLTGARARRTSGRPGQRFDSLEALRQAADIARAQGRPPEAFVGLRNEAIACLALPDLRLEHEWEGNLPGTNGLAFDARFERYAWSFKDEGIRVCRLEDHRELLRLPTRPGGGVSRFLDLGFSPDGRFLAAWYRQWGEGSMPLEVWDLHGGASGPRVALTNANCRAEFLPGGRELVVGLADNSVAVIDLASGRETRRLLSGPPVARLALHPAGRLLAVGCAGSGGVHIRDLQSGAVLRELPHPKQVAALAWHPEGTLLAAGCEDHRIHLWDAQSGQNQGTLEGHRWEVCELAFDPTGRWLASFGWDMLLQVWDVGFRQPVLKLDDVRVLSFRTSEGLGMAGLTGRQVRVWAFHPSNVYHVLHGHQEQSLTHVDFSPDSRWLASSGLRSDTRLWDVAGRREAGRLPDLGGVQWGPRGASLLASGPQGLRRLPVRPLGAGNADGIHLGPPVPVAGPAAALPEGLAAWCGPQRERLFVVSHTRIAASVHLFEIGEFCREKWSQKVFKVAYPAASRDGRRVAAGSFDGGNGVGVWEADTGRLEKELAIGDADVAFSADGRWLYTATGRLSPNGAECCAWHIGTWQADRRLALNWTPGAAPSLAVSPNGAILAVPNSPDVMRLLHAESFAPIALLTAPEPGFINRHVFSPDGRLLAAAVSNVLHLWDLARLNERLAELGLDWQRPRSPPQPPHPHQPLGVEIDPGPAAAR
jgi:serine/threonine protein kinase/WD40 repeat protein